MQKMPASVHTLAIKLLYVHAYFKHKAQKCYNQMITAYVLF